ncbi:T9SS type A sorting domain-containing protein [Fluviicola sp.]|uniref:T9SS type A sorting domain-containing protein n=1 Tax=Fluviicola sp. TaxID=1917219 RepID=UPI0026281868|nr:T9SS type A sorting domain-containing protein [Fluviicola sp.]
MKQIHTFLKCLPLILFIIFSSKNVASAQCPDGTLGVAGPGCGCLSGCNLTSLGGPNCSPSVGGDCTGGQRTMSEDIIVPAGCTYTITATMRNRTGGCTSSGADSGDKLKVDISGGGKGFQTGSSNATLNDSYTLAGPGTITVSGSANRADEIITYSTTSSGATCVSCMSTLPVELVSFDAKQEGNAVACSWSTQSEKNCDYFTVERSADGIHFDVLGYMKGAGNTSNLLKYKLYDSDPFFSTTSYYRLLQTDLNGQTRYLEVKTVKARQTHELQIFPNPSKGTIQISGEFEALQNSKLIDLSGRELFIDRSDLQNSKTLIISDLPVGIYSLMYFDNEKMVSERIVVTP